MSDYAAAAIEIVAEGLLTIDVAGNPVITGRGFSSVVRVAPTGDFLFTFDEGVIAADVGSGSIVNRPGFGAPDGRVGPNGIDPRSVRVALTMRSGTTMPGTTTIADKSVAISTGPGGTQLRVGLGNIADAPTDPMGAGAPNAAGGGLEIIVFYGNAGMPFDFSQQLVGPAYQPAMTFP